MSIVLGTAVGAALTVGQTAASASSSAWSLDIANPTVIFQNVVGSPGDPTVDPTIPATNAGNGWNFIATGWVAGDTITLTIGTPNGGPGVECNTNNLSNPTTPGFGVNQTDDDMSNYVLFDAADATNDGPDAPLSGTPTASIVESTSGSSAAYLSASLGAEAVSPNGQDCTDGAAGVGDTSDQLILTFLTTVSPTTTAEVFVGYAEVVGTPAEAVSVPVTYDTGFGAAVGSVPVTASYLSFGAAASTASAITVPSNALVEGENPQSVSASQVPRITGEDVVPSTAIPNFEITDVVGDQLPPNPEVTDIPVPIGAFGQESISADTPGDVCVVIDNSTHQNLVWTSTPLWSVTPNAGTNPDNASTGASTVSTDGTVLQLPVLADNALGTATTWTASGLTIGTATGDHTHADGPVWVFVTWVSTDTAALASDPGNCDDAVSTTHVHNRGDDDLVDQDGDEPTNTNELGYAQLTTVTELANSIYGATAVSTAAEAIGHQFDYAIGSCIGSAFPSFAHDGGPIFLATDADYHDALGASFPAGADDSAVALTDPGSLSVAAASIIREEGIHTVYIVGGTDAISAAVEATLDSTPSYTCGGVNPRYNVLGAPEDLTVIRIAGAVADDTNEMLATFTGAEPITPTPGFFGAFANPTLFNDTNSGISSPAPSVTDVVQNTAILVTDAGFSDAVAGSALAYGWPMPLITTTPGALSTDALNALSTDHINQVIAVGGTDAISDAVITELGTYGISAIRVAGIDGSDSSVQLASFELSLTDGVGVNNDDFDWSAFTARTAGEITSPGFEIFAHAVLLARDDFYADAETASVLSVHNGLYGDDTTLKPLVLAENPTTLGSYVSGFLGDAGLPVSTLPGEAPAQGWRGGFNFGLQYNPSSSNVYTIQPIGGIDALATATLDQAIAAVTSG